MNCKEWFLCLIEWNYVSNSTHKESVFIKEVAGQQKRRAKILEFTHSSTKAAGVMLLGAIIAIIVANSAYYAGFAEFWESELSIGFGGSHVSMSLAEIINDVFMAIFFLLVGLEIKYEMTVGELTNIRQAILPVAAAFGGVLVPIVIYLSFNAGSAETIGGWGVPTATDIAFALGILSLLGSRVPNGVRVFLSTLAVADDIIAIIVIAVFYGHSPEIGWLIAAGVTFLLLLLLNHKHVYSLVPYIVVGAVLWYCVFMSGVHSTIAGVLLAFTIPTGSHVNLRKFIDWSGNRVKEAKKSFVPGTPVIGQSDYLDQITRLARVSRQVVPPATRLERALHPWVYFAILPLFALTNADVSFAGSSLSEMVMSPVFLGVFFGLVLGKPIGIMLMSALIVKFKISSLPENVNWLHMLGAALLGGVGFTMAIFVANLAFASEIEITIAKVAILSASLLAGVVGFLFLLLQAKGAARKGVLYELDLENNTNMLTHAAHESARREKIRRKKNKEWKQGHAELVENMERRQAQEAQKRAERMALRNVKESNEKKQDCFQNDVVEPLSKS